MKKILRAVLFNIAGIYLAGQALGGISYSGEIKVLAIAGVALTLAEYVVRPVIKIVTLPINVITLGVFSWLIDVFILYLVTVFVPYFYISPFTFSGFSYNGFSIPAMAFSHITAFAVSSFAISLIVNVFKYICN